MKTEITMKKILISLIGMMGLLGLVGCEKDHMGPETNQDRDIFYTVSEGSAVAGFSGTTTHTSTEAEFDALLDSFCNYALNGGHVMFCSSRPASQAKSSSTDTPTSISTTDREELKTWMKEMEKAGKTVQITYEDGSGTWHGRAYVNLGQGDLQESQTYSGTLVFVPTPVLEEPPLGGVVWAMQEDGGSTLIITLHGMMMWSESIDDNMRIIQGAALTLEGVSGTYTDLQGNTFRTLSLYVEEN